MDQYVHRVAAGLLVADGRVLLGHRHPLRRYYPDCWDAVGGHIEPGESPEQALARECVEEIGVVVTHARLATTTRLDDLELHAFVIDGWQGRPTNLAPDEHDDLRWFGPDELSGLPLAHPALGDLVLRVTAAP
ncbi:NUDIX domain-containing protein [Janibacter limosus]|uniref:NUDIX domain-containing protein n=1 Tax=Janibacter limosus TaxID=53458 RepID=UPI001FE13267|nr:NUDIX domain-containing protein [Janibacter limosus]